MSPVRRVMALASTTLPTKTGLSLWCPTSHSLVRHFPARVSPIGSRGLVTASFANENREVVIVGGGNAAGYAARTFVENGMDDGRICIVTKEAYAPYERPTLTKAYVFPLEKKPSRLPGFHTCVGGGGERQTQDWYKEKGIEVIYEDPVAGADFEKQTLTTNTVKIWISLLSKDRGKERGQSGFGGE